MKLNSKSLIFECDRLFFFLTQDFKGNFREVVMVLHGPMSIYSLKKKDIFFLLKVCNGTNISLFSPYL